MPTRLLILAVAPFRDAALLVAPLAARRALMPDDRVTVATSPGAAEVVRALGLADEVWEAAEQGRAPRTSRDALRMGSLLFRAQRARFDSVVDCFPTPASMLAALAATGGRSVTASPRYTDMLLGARGAAALADDPVERIAGLIGVATVAAEPAATLDPESSLWVERALSAIGYDGGPVVVVHSAGLWPRERFVEVAGRLRSGSHSWIVALDEPHGGRFAPGFADALGGRVLAASSPSGARFVAALARASLVLTDDAGVASLATFAGAPALLVARSGGATLPTLHDRIVLASAEPHRIDPEAVFDAASKLVAKPRTTMLFR